MPRPKKPIVPPSPSVWSEPEPRPRAAPVQLSRATIVKAALALADRGGLAAVSLRAVAGRLGVMPMRLYTYTSTKDGLLELMADAVYGEIMDGLHLRGDWRRAVTTIARRTREVAARRAWFVELFGGRPHQGPEALAYVEAFLSAFTGAPGAEDIDRRMQAFRTVHAYLVGIVRAETAERRAEKESGLSKRAWQQSSEALIGRIIASGDFPMLTRLVREAGDPSPDDVFEDGLGCVLDGVAARLGAAFAG